MNASPAESRRSAPVLDVLRPQERLLSGSAAWPRHLRIYVVLHATWLALYAFLGKGFAYAGWAPVYVSEVLLFFAFATLLCSSRVLSLLRSPLGVMMVCFFSWQLHCLLPY